MKKSIIIFLSALFIFGLIIFFLNKPTYAHQSGCHRWHSCPSDSGSYVCGDWGYSNYCGTTSTPIYTPPVYKAPVITTKDIDEYSEIPFSTTTRNDSDEYIGYKVLEQSGSVGKLKRTTRVTYSNGVETNKSAPNETIDTPAVDEIYAVGTRPLPQAYIDKISKSDNQSLLDRFAIKYDIFAAAKKGSYALIKNSKVVAVGEASSNGRLIFRAHLHSGDKIAIGSYYGHRLLWMMPKATSISETYTVYTYSPTVTAEYDVVHNKKSDRAVSEYKVCSKEIKESYKLSRTKEEAKSDKFIYDKDNPLILYFPQVPCLVDEV